LDSRRRANPAVMRLCGWFGSRSVFEKGAKVKKRIYFYIVAVPVICIIIKATFQYLERNVSTGFGWILPLLNLGSAFILGTLLATLLDNLSYTAKPVRMLLLSFFIAAHLGVYFSSYVVDYYNLKIGIARSDNVSYEEASRKLDAGLQEATGSTGFWGYLRHVWQRGAKPINPDDVPDGLLDLIIFMLLRLFQWLSTSVLHLKIAGLIEMCFWYVIWLVLTLVGVRFSNSTA
jgi:hypothetical protein